MPSLKSRLARLEKALAASGPGVTEPLTAEERRASMRALMRGLFADDGSLRDARDPRDLDPADQERWSRLARLFEVIVSGQTRTEAFTTDPFDPGQVRSVAEAWGITVEQLRAVMAFGGAASATAGPTA